MNRCRAASALALLGLSTVFAVGCDHAARPGVTTPSPATSAKAPVGTTSQRVEHRSLRDVGLDPDALDRSVDPCRDFYQFACGGWLAKTEIPADEPGWSRGNGVAKRNEAELRSILEAAAQAKSGQDAGRAKLGAFYGACMDESAIEIARTKALDPLFAQARGVQDATTLAAALVAMHKRGIWAVFDISDEQDSKDATKVIATIDQDGLGLPDRDYYVKDDPKSKELRATYLAHVTRVFKLLKRAPAAAEQAAHDVMDVETELAKISKTRVERRDPQTMYNKIDRPGLVQAAPSFPWESYFKGLGVADIRDINVTSPAYLTGFGKLMSSIKPTAWRNYLAWQIVHATAPTLPKAFVDEAFTMEAALTGQKQRHNRWKQCVEATDRALGDDLAKPFVEAKFAGASRDAARAMVLAVSDAFGRRVGELAWMDAPTRAKAKAKLNRIAYLIGYPSKWRSYDFAVTPKAYAANVLAAREADLAYHLAKIAKPVDREEWQMTPPTVNAYYQPQMNQMVFPAGILQPPFYDLHASVAVNLGGIGAIVGHELTHGFDDQGAQYDGAGNLVDWWTPEVSTRFHERTGCVAMQYGEYEPLPGVKLNGKLTVGENIADIGGVKLAFRAYRQMRAGAQTAEVADGFNEDQQFFLAFGQANCSKSRDESVRMFVQGNPHPPRKFRVNGSLADTPEFGQAFVCAEGTPMHPKHVCEVW